MARVANTEVDLLPVRGHFGRPRKEIDWVEFDDLCRVQCTLAEISAHFSVSEDTIERRVFEQYGTTFAELFAQKRKAGFVSLRRKQFELAMMGNPTMLIWLGKQVLGQSDQTHLRAEVSCKEKMPLLSATDVREILRSDPFLKQLDSNSDISDINRKEF